jgi:hypothetical protein
LSKVTLKLEKSVDGSTNIPSFLISIPMLPFWEVRSPRSSLLSSLSRLVYKKSTAELASKMKKLSSMGVKTLF